MRFLLALILGTLFSASVSANPIALPEGREAESPGPERWGVDIEMVSENVSLTLSRVSGIVRQREFVREPAVARLDVKGTYNFKNPGEKRAMTIGFPSNGKVEAASMRVSMDGTELEARYLQRKEERDWVYDDWMEWEAEFPGASECQMKVEYSLLLYEERKTGYIIRSGAGWAGEISEAVVTLKLGEGFEVGHLRDMRPSENLEIEDGVYTWKWTDFEPERSDDISVDFSLETWEERIARIKLDTGHSWRSRLKLAEDLAEPPFAEDILENLGDGQRNAFLDALEGLVPRIEEADGRVIIFDDTTLLEPDPEGRTSGNREDTYEDIFDEVIWLAIQAVEKLESEPRAREVLSDLVKIMKAADEEKLDLSADGNRQSVDVRTTDLEHAEELLAEEAD